MYNETLLLVCELMFLASDEITLLIKGVLSVAMVNRLLEIKDRWQPNILHVL